MQVALVTTADISTNISSSRVQLRTTSALAIAVCIISALSSAFEAISSSYFREKSSLSAFSSCDRPSEIVSPHLLSLFGTVLLGASNVSGDL